MRCKLQPTGNGPQKAQEEHRKHKSLILCFLCSLSCLLWSVSPVFALLAAQNLPLEPVHESGASITGAFEGWFTNPDGSFSLLLGYFNRNAKQEVDIPVGLDNRIEPGGPDQGLERHNCRSLAPLCKAQVGTARKR